MKALRRCRNNMESDVIDLDTYIFNNVIDIDVLESLTKKRGGSSNDKNRPSRTYIYIDDDETPSERNMENRASSSWRYGEDHENISPLKLSKGKRTYSGRRLSTQSDGDSSEDENIDCEFMEDSSGKLREQWERASLKRKGDNCDFGVVKSKGKCVEDEKKGKSPYDSEDGIPFVEASLSDRDEHTPSSSSEEEENEEKNDENSIIDQREKLKETDEYKRALEEELSARQIALKIQAEEAQQLRRLQKRKKAESLRLLDMERRQKQRVEEIRETQKKDEENMNLKETYRMEVREELKKLEMTCCDMASLLRGLGIQVGNEVRTAYKRALLSFHPDRASGSDMRHQVEAEEKFKLISRMKEKLSM